MDFLVNGNKIGVLPIKPKTTISDLKNSLDKWADENGLTILSILITFGDGTQLDPFIFTTNKWDGVNFEAHKAKIPGGTINVKTSKGKEKLKSDFTGIRDVDLYIAEKLDDVSAIRFLMTIPGLYTEKNIAFIFGKRYPDLIRYREEGESLKSLYLRMLRYIGLLREKFNYIYVSGNPIDDYGLLSKHMKKNMKKKDFDDLLEKSVMVGNLNLVKYAFQKGANIKTARPIIAACEEGHLPVVRFLVEAGADVNTNGGIPLIVASRYGHLEIVKYLVEAGANVNPDGLDVTPLIAASEKGDLKIVRFLVEAGANVNANGDIALITASEHGHLEIVKYLVEKGANVNAQNGEALYFAAYHNKLPIVKVLVEAGADVNIGNSRALRRAAKRKLLKIVKYLVDAGANIRAKDDEALRTANKLPIVKILVEAGANIHANNDEALRIASETGNLELVQYLVGVGANVNADDDYAVRLASEEGELEIVKFLVEAGANIHALNDYALRAATKNKHSKVVKYIRSLKN